MTTIVGTPDCLVADSRCSDSDQQWLVEKVVRIGGALYATAGGAADGERFYSWIRRGKRGKRPAVDDSFDALALTKDGLFLFDSEMYPMKLLNEHAIGSGAKAARGALLAGAPPVRAVEIACQVDAGSSGPVRVFYLDEKKETQ